MLIIALTGGIGSGKSVVTNMFAELGAPIIDTDVIARELVQPGQPAYAEIIDLFGDAILRADKHLDRRKLRDIIFESASQRRQLEAILHPRIRDTVQARVTELHNDYCIVVIPLLTETGTYPFIDRVLVVDSDPEQQIARTMQRDKQSRAAVEQIIKAQASREQRLKLANDVIENNADLASLKLQVHALDRKYRQLTKTS